MAWVVAAMCVLLLVKVGTPAVVAMLVLYINCWLSYSINKPIVVLVCWVLGGGPTERWGVQLGGGGSTG